ncbi:MFS transporter [Tsukamurella pulmonis]|uniref:Predicted arabinose efflux permease, MFS family n=2 Tax=Tsukamurella pulmonis TaxID=47312 RepID=A0A1H1HBP6_9ACTN|nr:MFS transporter [Tsukamurella pulmonis]KXO94864.1 MFS transporter [Tsukamurella pulmonis]KXP12892.1 MFS transporter [Tsukamurella pulmonis]SDR22884.1 Predicted arabinose efflux permease, MFS family [Tsukamurella pulmonis]SUP15279.1 methyl viologen resistance protein SmvA [Tsukamurella pulmonis]
MTTRLPGALVTVALCAAVVGSVGAPLITAVARSEGVSLGAAQWTLTITLFTGAIAGPVLGRLGGGPLRRRAILGTLGLVAVGGVLTVLPTAFGALLVGRALQGVGIALVPLLVSVARSALPVERSAGTIASLSVASTVGIGVGYPLISFVDQQWGLRAAYGAGLAITVAALVVAWRFVPVDAPGPRPRIDVRGALLLAAGTFGALLLVAEPAVWGRPAVAIGVLGGTVATLAAWVRVELRTDEPLVDLRLVARPPVAAANLAMLVSGVGMYLLFSDLTRYVQVPAGAPYGFALPGVAAGAALIPFSVLGFVAGRVVPRIASRIGPRATFAMSSALVVAAAGIFVAGRDRLPAVLASLAVLGFAVGVASAVMPRLVLDGTPQSETASVMAVNQIARAVGFAVGSALAGLLLARATPAGALLPAQGGYIAAALWVILPAAASVAVLAAGSARSRGRVSTR